MSETFSRWRSALSKTSRATFGRVASLLGATEITDETWENLESILIQADLGMETASSVLNSLRLATRTEGLLQSEALNSALKAELVTRLQVPPGLDLSARPTVIFLVGVNGSGKTTTAAKLGQRFLSEGRTVLFGAADTFRAAAVDQLQVWGARLQVPVVAGAAESDPGAVTFNAIQSAQARGIEVVLIDTAGRLHTRSNLMEELKKVHRVAGKALTGAPHHVWLVLDSTTGQNALHQARAFLDAVAVTGVILTKLDSSAKGGMAFAIQHELGLPIFFAGLGEQAQDLTPFDPSAFVDGILQTE